MAVFGTVFMPTMALTRFENDTWTETEFVSADSIQMHPGAHVLHYSSTCFEGLKAFRHEDGSINIFRMDRNIERFAQSSRLLNLPEIDKAQVEKMIIDIVSTYSAEVPEPPGSMYIRPGGLKPLRLLLDETGMRCAPHMGMVKSGGNYASALPPILKAKADVQADQILFCPNGDVQETGAANFLLVDGNEIITKGLDTSFLHGVTRATILQLAKDHGMTVSERDITVEELLERAAKPSAEAALSGTAAVLTPVGTFIHNGKEYQVGNGEAGPVTMKLRQALNDIQWGKAEDKHNWLVKINPT